MLLNRLTAQMERGLLPWIFWSYDENIIPTCRSRPADETCPVARPRRARPPVPGRDRRHADADRFDPATGAFDFAYDTTGPGGATYPNEVLTVVSVPARHYPDGYAVTVAPPRGTRTESTMH